MGEPNHSCPVCRCKWNPREGTQIEAVNANVQRMAREIRILRARLAEENADG